VTVDIGSSINAVSSKVILKDLD